MGRNRKRVAPDFEKTETIAVLSCLSTIDTTEIGVAMKTKIYFLRGENRFVVYVGKTTISLEKRLRVHLYEARKGDKTHKSRGIRKMLREGKSPVIDLITEVNGDGVKAEQAYIKWLRSKGVNLWNITIGGEGTLGYHHTEDWKIRMSIKFKGRNTRGKGWHHTNTAKEKISRGNTGIPSWCKGLKLPSPTPEARQRMSDSHTGLPWSKARREAQEIMNRTRELNKRQNVTHSFN